MNFFKKAFIVVGFFTLAHANDLVEISFDSLFPPSPFKHALDICMQLYGDLAACNDQALTQSMAPAVMDALLGQLVRLRAAVCAVRQEGRSIPHDDTMYMLVMLDRLETAYEECSHSKEHATLAGMLLAEIKQSMRACAAQSSF